MNPADLLRFSSRRGTPVVLQNEVAECGLACLAMPTCTIRSTCGSSDARRIVEE